MVTDSDQPIAEMSRRDLLVATILLEGGLAVAAVVWMWWTGTDVTWLTSAQDAVAGALIGVAFGVVALAALATPWRFFAPARRDFQLVLRLFQKHPLVDLAAVSIAAGVCEEALFRGALQGWLYGSFSPAVAILIASVLFGLAHPISTWYVVSVALIGLVLGYLFHVTHGLTAPIAAHASYDFVVLWLGTRFFARIPLPTAPASDDAHPAPSTSSRESDPGDPNLPDPPQT